MTSPLDNGCHGDDEEDENLLAEYESDDEKKEKDGKVGEEEGEKDEEEEHVTKVKTNEIDRYRTGPIFSASIKFNSLNLCQKFEKV